MTKINDVESYPHCDEDGCDLGEVIFKCPVCYKLNIDYGDLWWDGWKIRSCSNTMVERCEYCNAELFFFGVDGEIKVRVKEENDVIITTED